MIFDKYKKNNEKLTGVDGVTITPSGDYIIRFQKMYDNQISSEVEYNLTQGKVISNTNYDSMEVFHFIYKRYQEFTKEDFRDRAKQFIVPSVRENIEDVLEELGFREYDVLKLFVINSGHLTNSLEWFRFKPDTQISDIPTINQEYINNGNVERDIQGQLVWFLMGIKLKCLRIAK